MAIRQISVYLENQNGSLEGALEVLYQAGVDLRAMSLADTQKFGMLRLIVRGTDKACEALRAAGYVLADNAVVAVEIPDEPGGLYHVVQRLSKEGVSVEYSYAFLLPHAGQVCVVLRVDDNARAEAILEAAGIVTLYPGNKYE